MAAKSMEVIYIKGDMRIYMEGTFVWIGCHVWALTCTHLDEVLCGISVCVA